MRPSPWASAMAQLLVAHPNQAIFRPPPPGVFLHRVGAAPLVRAACIEIGTYTLEEAKARALALPNCAGFAVNTNAPTFGGRKPCFFTTRRDVGDGDDAWLWQTWLKT